MKKLVFILLILILNTFIYPQDISVVQHQFILTDTLNSEMIFSADVTNISQADQTVFIVRSINNLPDEWLSALCFSSCFPSEFDSIATTTYFGSSPLIPGETREIALHIFPFVNVGTGYAQLQIGTFRTPDERVEINLTAIVEPTSMGNQNNVEVSKYYLEQNYPNPFNPSTQIKFGLRESGYVSLKVYNILGNEVSTVVSGYKSAGNHVVNFEGSGLSSGVYFYRITVGNYSEIRKMILEK